MSDDAENDRLEVPQYSDAVAAIKRLRMAHWMSSSRAPTWLLGDLEKDLVVRRDAPRLDGSVGVGQEGFNQLIEDNLSLDLVGRAGVIIQEYRQTYTSALLDD